ncbi:MAG: hypothetical protein JXA11_15445 [Phycisphaerae bacterium]|nr:hypothetical protein [Phycisphaerae bacterium]
MSILIGAFFFCAGGVQDFAPQPENFSAWTEEFSTKRIESEQAIYGRIPSGISVNCYNKMTKRNTIFKIIPMAQALHVILRYSFLAYEDHENEFVKHDTANHTRQGVGHTGSVRSTWWE